MFHGLLVGLTLALGAQADVSGDAGLVHVFVTATDARGRTVEDLQPADFRIDEEQVAREVASLRFIRAEGALAPGEAPGPIRSADDERREAAKEGTRIVGIFLDEYHVSPGAAAETVREALLALVNRHLGPRDLVVLLKPLDSILRIRATRDLGWVRAEIASFEGRKGRLEPRNAFEETFIAASPVQVEAVRAQISTSVLHAMITHLGDLPGGRKGVIIASEGFDRGPRRRGEALPTAAGLVRLAQRGGVVIHALDPRPEVSNPPAASAADGAAPLASGREMLRALTGDTEGYALFGPDGWGDGIARIVADLSHYYILGFRPAAEGDGRRRALAIRVTRPSIRLRAPQGYWTESPLDRLRVALAEQRPAPMPAALPVRRTSPLIRPWFGIGPESDGIARVTFVWEAVDRQPGGRRPTAEPARVRMRVTTPEGTPVYEAVVAPATPTHEAAALAAFDAPVGRLRVELTIEDTESRRLDTDVRDIVVERARDTLAFGTAAILRGRTARDLRELRNDPHAAPSSSRAFSRTELLLIRLPVHPADEELEISALLVSRAGRVMRELTLESAPIAGMQQVELPLAGLPAGEYRLELRASHNGESISEALDFRVVP
jgi:VWFA-related protein